MGSPLPTSAPNTIAKWLPVLLAGMGKLAPDSPSNSYRSPPMTRETPKLRASGVELQRVVSINLAVGFAMVFHQYPCLNYLIFNADSDPLCNWCEGGSLFSTLA